MNESDADEQIERELWDAWRFARSAGESPAATEEESYELRGVVRTLDKLLKRRGEVTVSMPTDAARAIVEIGGLEEWDDGDDPALRAGYEALKEAAA